MSDKDSGNMRVAVFADTHGNKRAVLRAMQENGPFDACLHLGDGVADGFDASREMNVPFYGVAGNEDRDGTFVEKRMIITNGVPMMMLHGHQEEINPYQEKEVLEGHYRRLASVAREGCAEMLLFGHTHKPLARLIDGVVLFNPGSMYAGTITGLTFGILDIDSHVIRMGIRRFDGKGIWESVSFRKGQNVSTLGYDGTGENKSAKKIT